MRVIEHMFCLCANIPYSVEWNYGALWWSGWCRFINTHFWFAYLPASLLIRKAPCISIVDKCRSHESKKKKTILPLLMRSAQAQAQAQAHESMCIHQMYRLPTNFTRTKKSIERSFLLCFCSLQQGTNELSFTHCLCVIGQCKQLLLLFVSE